MRYLAQTYGGYSIIVEVGERCSCPADGDLISGPSDWREEILEYG